MKCPNCGLENIPGAERCFRCGTLLKTEQKINFYPPRAKNKNNIKGLERRKNRGFLKGLKRRRNHIVFKNFSTDISLSNIIKLNLQSFLPGFGHLRYGHIERGILFFLISLPFFYLLIRLLSVFSLYLFLIPVTVSSFDLNILYFKKSRVILKKSTLLYLFLFLLSFNIFIVSIFFFLISFLLRLGGNYYGY